MKINQVVRQEMTVSKRTLKYAAHAKDSVKLTRPTYELVIKSWHQKVGFSYQGDVAEPYTLISMTIPKTTAEALVQDHGAKWDETTLGKMG